MRSWDCVWGRRVSAPVEVPEDIVERIRTLCLALPEVTVRVDYSRTRARSTAQSFDIRRRSFCLLVATEGSTGRAVTDGVKFREWGFIWPRDYFTATAAATRAAFRR